MDKFKAGDIVICKKGYAGFLYTGGRYKVVAVYNELNAISVVTEDGELDLFGFRLFELDKNSIVGDIIRDL